MKSKLIALGLFVAASMAVAIPASGITFGREVTNGSTSYPSVVSIWMAEDAEDDAMTYMDRLGDSLFYTGTDKERTNIFPVTLKESV